GGGQRSGGAGRRRRARGGGVGLCPVRRASPRAAGRRERGGTMSRLRFTISTSLDGYVAGPDQTREEPLGRGGEGLHEWVVRLRSWREAHGLEGGEVNRSDELLRESTANVGATI